MELPESINYRYRRIGDQYVLWIGNINRYIKLEEPAFRVISSYFEGQIEKEILSECAAQYDISAGEAKRFVRELLESIQKLFQESAVAKDPAIPMDLVEEEGGSLSYRYIHANDRIIGIGFHNEKLERRIMPQFEHLESSPPARPPDLNLKIGICGKLLTMVVDQDQAFGWPLEDFNILKGAMSLHILDCLYQTTNEDWMGVVHGSAISLGNNSVLFPAQSGEGKSTLAAIMMAHGCGFISDDFTPISIGNGNCYPYPAAISIKPGSLDVLSSYYPELSEKTKDRLPNGSTKATFLKPLIADPIPMEGYPVTAIVFVEYDLDKDFRIQKISNFDALNYFFDETWLAPHVHAAEKFLDWFFQIPCYRLHYSKLDPAIEVVMKLLKHDP